MSRRLNLSSDLSKFTKSARSIVVLADLLGWNCRWDGGERVLTMHSPDGTFQSRLPTTNLNSNRANSTMKQVLRYSDPLAIASLAAGNMDLAHQPSEVQRIVTLLSMSLRTWMDDEQEKEDRAKAERGEPLPPPEPLPERSLVSEAPFRAIRTDSGKAEVRTYQSDRITERRWSDGTVDYLCTTCREFHSPNHLSVRSHSNAAHRTELPLQDVPRLTDMKSQDNRRVEHVKVEVDVPTPVPVPMPPPRPVEEPPPPPPPEPEPGPLLAALRAGSQHWYETDSADGHLEHIAEHLLSLDVAEAFAIAAQIITGDTLVRAQREIDRLTAALNDTTAALERSKANFRALKELLNEEDS